MNFLGESKLEIPLFGGSQCKFQISAFVSVQKRACLQLDHRSVVAAAQQIKARVDGKHFAKIVLADDLRNFTNNEI